MIEGSGLCSPGRWDPQSRHVDQIAEKIRAELMKILRTKWCDVIQLLFELAVGKHASSPFTEEMRQSGRRVVMAIVGMRVDDETATTPVEGQPFYLHILSEVARVLGDPDWRILVRAKESFASGVRVGYKTRLPRTPAVFERKKRWRKYDPEDFALEIKANYQSMVGSEQQIKAQYEEGR